MTTQFDQGYQLPSPIPARLSSNATWGLADLNKPSPKPKTLTNQLSSYGQSQFSQPLFGTNEKSPFDFLGTPQLKDPMAGLNSILKPAEPAADIFSLGYQGNTPGLSMNTSNGFPGMGTAVGEGNGGMWDSLKGFGKSVSDFFPDNFFTSGRDGTGAQTPSILKDIVGTVGSALTTFNAWENGKATRAAMDQAMRQNAGSYANTVLQANRDSDQKFLDAATGRTAAMNTQPRYN